MDICGNDHDEPPRAVDALDAGQLDVARCGRARDEDDRPALPRARLERCDQLRHRLDDRLGTNDADMQVGDEAQCPAALAGTAVESDRARLGASGGTGRHGPVERVEIAGAEGGVFDELDTRYPELVLEVDGDSDTPRVRGDESLSEGDLWNRVKSRGGRRRRRWSPGSTRKKEKRGTRRKTGSGRGSSRKQG